MLQKKVEAEELQQENEEKMEAEEQMEKEESGGKSDHIALG